MNQTNRSKVISIRLSAAEYSQIAADAELQKQAVSGVLLTAWRKQNVLDAQHDRLSEIGMRLDKLEASMQELNAVAEWAAAVNGSMQELRESSVKRFSRVDAFLAAADAQGLSNYYGDLAREDYYTTGGEPPGQWLGRGAESFGLTGELRQGELLSAMQGFHPRENHPLVPNAGNDRKPGWDCCFSAPKTVSAVWAVVDRDTQIAIQRAQAKAVKSAVAYLEREAVFARRGHGGKEREPPDGIVAAAFEHSTSRNQDPQLHTHVLIMNLAARADGTVGGVDLDTRHKMTAGALYRTELARRLRGLGFEIKRDGSSFQIDGVHKDLTVFWSSRRAEVLATLQSKGLTSGRAAEIAALDTRESKSEINRTDLFSCWRKQAEELGFSQERMAGIRAIEPTPAQTMKDAGQILREATERASTVSRLQLLHRVVVEAQGALSAREAEAYLVRVTEHGDCVRLIGPNDELRYTTREMIDIEQRMADHAVQLTRNVGRQIDRSVVSRLAESRTLTPEQLAAVEHIVSTSGAIACVQGHAGTGKSYMLDTAREAWESHGYQVRGAALAGKAAKGSKRVHGSRVRPCTHFSPNSMEDRPRSMRGLS